MLSALPLFCCICVQVLCGSPCIGSLSIFFLSIQPKSAEHILEALDSGNRNRTQHPTDMNATSSRSHAVFQVFPSCLIEMPKDTYLASQIKYIIIR